ncbi:glycoside hydrolase family 43 protein [Sphingomonas qomolangmaensis]|uniref:Glycoside hydrolase 43 family protein n=1 Tax=Sphingomonas qomolangmaensis TaxID=2918765 RepID=A0ABY5LEQ2_9SPHN|nr:glycoside hydrolase 43 family protein [Sphingomonas qomolangmaensis]UUL83191.1 glycoside hydrolase 43 family protein [Sphingomonas qomolangmaensis]
MAGRRLGLGLALAMAATIAAANAGGGQALAQSATWTADNGNGTFTNPLFFDEFSDPDMIRVGDDFYLTGTTMHAMPGLPILHSRDLVNWKFVGYAMDKLDLGPEFRLEGGKNVYGRGIWAPSFRYRDGVFYIFTNINGQNSQIFSATSPGGPWKRTPMKRSLHDMSVLFDDDGKTWVVWGYQDIHLAQLDATLTDIVPGTERIIIRKGEGMGEGSHFYKFAGRYFITSAEWASPFRMPAARADALTGPWEVNRAISIDEDFGQINGWRVAGNKEPITLVPPSTARGALALHQGGIIQTPAGEWWGWSMFEGNSVGRLTGLSPITWKDGWPYFGLPGNLGRTPRTWVKPALPVQPIRAPYARGDRFDGPALGAVWQWNHVPVDANWSLRARPGALRLTTLPAAGFLQARNTLTQRAMGPQSAAVVEIDASGLRTGDVAGLALLNRPHASIAIERTGAGLALVVTDELRGEIARQQMSSDRVWLRADGDFATDQAQFAVSTDGRRFSNIGTPITMPYQLLTFQGVRYSLFAYNKGSKPGGHADFLDFAVNEPRAESRPAIPYGKQVRFIPIGAAGSPMLAQPLLVQQHPLGRVSLLRGGQALTVAEDGAVTMRRADGGAAQQFQWMEALTGGALLMSLETNRYLHVADDGSLRADSPGATADNKDRSRFSVR